MDLRQAGLQRLQERKQPAVKVVRSVEVAGVARPFEDQRLAAECVREKIGLRHREDRIVLSPDHEGWHVLTT